MRKWKAQIQLHSCLYQKKRQDGLLLTLVHSRGRQDACHLCPPTQARDAHISGLCAKPKLCCSACPCQSRSITQGPRGLQEHARLLELLMTTIEAACACATPASLKGATPANLRQAQIHNHGHDLRLQSLSQAT